jgi:hypothetical protein
MYLVPLCVCFGQDD